jgi:hypothetical protein
MPPRLDPRGVAPREQLGVADPLAQPRPLHRVEHVPEQADVSARVQRAQALGELRLAAGLRRIERALGALALRQRALVRLEKELRLEELGAPQRDRTVHLRDLAEQAALLPAEPPRVGAQPRDLLAELVDAGRGRGGRRRERSRDHKGEDERPRAHQNSGVPSV